MDETHVQELLREYLRFHQLANTLECFEAELKTKQFTTRNAKKQQSALTDEQLAELPRIYSFAEGDKPRAAKEAVMEKQLKGLEKNYNVVVQTGRQLFAITVDTVERLAAMDDRNPGEKGSTDQYKAQLSKFHKILMSDASVSGEDGHAWFNEANLTEVRTTVSKALKSKEYTQVLEQLITLRANALSVLSKHRRKIDDQMIKNDVFSGNALSLLRVKNHEVKTSALALVSMLASTGKGVAYVLSPRADSTVQALVEIMSEEESGSVTQRFAIGALQKIVALDDAVSSALIDSGVVGWLKTSLLERALLHGEFMHTFCLDFGSALLANLLNSASGTSYLSVRLDEAVDLGDKLLSMLSSDKVESTTIIHILIVLTSLSAQRFFQPYMDQLQFSDKISDFVERFSQRKAEDTDDMDNRKTILDMCAHLFHPRESSASGLDTSEVMEFNANKHQDDIRELEQRLEDENEVIVFECFPDEVALM